jgi:hypothetical protein
MCAEFLGESFVVAAWWSYIALVSAYCEDFYCTIYLNDSFSG